MWQSESLFQFEGGGLKMAFYFDNLIDRRYSFKPIEDNEPSAFKGVSEQITLTYQNHELFEMIDEEEWADVDRINLLVSVDIYKDADLNAEKTGAFVRANNTLRVAIHLPSDVFEYIKTVDLTSCDILFNIAADENLDLMAIFKIAELEKNEKHYTDYYSIEVKHKKGTIIYPLPTQSVTNVDAADYYYGHEIRRNDDSIKEEFLQQTYEINKNLATVASKVTTVSFFLMLILGYIWYKF